MTHFLGMRRALFAVLAAAVAANSASAVDIHLGTMKADRILFFGNSITMSPTPVAGTNWPGGWGMAASEPAKDYVHLVVGSISETAVAMPEYMATYNLDFELNHATYDFQSAAFQEQLAFQPDIVVVAIGENVPALSTPEQVTGYAAAFGNLLSTFKSNGNPEIFVRGSFWPDETKDTIMKQAAIAAGCVFVDQSEVGIPENWAANEPGNPFQNDGYGVKEHPGDQGMQAIADSLFGAMVAHSAPEPGSVALLMIGTLTVLMHTWGKREFK